jgi:energy-coupling factor transport system permease protein
MSNIALGRYIPLDSIVHKFDPRMKIIAMFFLLVAVFIPAGYYGYGVLGLFIVGVLLIAKLKLNFIFRAMKPMMFMLVFLLVINVLVLRTGYVLFSIYGFKIYSDAIFQTLYITFRLALMIMITTALTATTKPLDLTLAIEDLLAPMKRFGVPAHEIAMMISIALRFIPTLIEETERIMKAQASRGVDLKEGKFKEKIMAILSLIVPLFVSSFQRAEDLADAMEARGYVPSAKRTRYKQLKRTLKDYIMIFIILILLGILIAMAVFK